MKKTQKVSPGDIPIKDKLEAARAVVEGKTTQAALAAEFGVSRQAVHHWMQLYRAGELHEGRGGRGRPPVRNLTAKEGAGVKKILVSQTPSEAGIGDEFTRWDYKSIKQLIHRETGVKLTYRIIAEHMDRWGLPHGPDLPEIDEDEAATAEKPKPQPLREVTDSGRVVWPPPPKRPRGRPRKVEKQEDDVDREGVDLDEEEEDLIDYESEIERSRQFLANLRKKPGVKRGKHAKQRRTPFQGKKKGKKRK